MSDPINTWLPGMPSFTFGATLTAALASGAGGAAVLRIGFSANSDGLGVTFDMFSPVLQITRPPKISYSATGAMTIVLTDAAGWLWAAPMPAQATLAERGWSWDRFELHSVQENPGDPPLIPAAGNIRAIQVQGASGVTYPLTCDLAYIAGRSPAAASVGSISRFGITSRESGAITLKVGDVAITNGVRTPVRYLGTLPFGLQENGPSRSGRAPTPYRGPFIAGYQSGTPWVELNNATALNAMLDFMAESQVQFAARHPTNLMGPFMHCFLPATWDSKQTGAINSWVWDAPDGNPAWPGWQWRAIDGMGATWAAAVERGGMATSATKAALVCNRFLGWLQTWLAARPEADYLPSSWGPPGWTQGTPLPAGSYLDPQGTTLEPHDVALAMKGAIYAFRAGGNAARSKEIVRRCVRMLRASQVTGTGPMRGGFSLAPAGFVAYGFQQGEVHDALALALKTPAVLAA
jgi:hypothetical protein